MNFLRRAFIYCYRQKLKTLILFLVLVIISTFILTGIAIKDASGSATTDLQTSVGGKLILEPDTENNMSSGEANDWGGTTYSYTGDQITSDIVDAISKVDGVVDYNSEDTASYYASAVDFEYLPASYSLNYTSYGASASYTATLSSERCSDFESGNYTLVDGRHITADDFHVVMISKELADYNKLSVGDKIQLYSLDTDSTDEFEIVGIYDGTEGTSGDALTVDQIPSNCGYIDYASMFDMFSEDVLSGYQELTIYVEDPVSIQNVYDRVEELPELKDKTLKLSIDTDEYDVISNPLDSLKSLVSTIIIIISLVSVVILTLLLTIWIRGRKKEIGILLSIGKSKENVILQFFTETFIVAVLAFVCSIPSSKLIANRASEFLISRVSSDISSLNVVISSKYLFPVYSLGMLFILISVVIASCSIIRLKPKDILTKMS